ncbi:MAG: hypothetical protein MUO31_06950 [Thermodesulfovibrionales bacterium]|nr:hypothetical protein [Thermodesulfovibrionales bacterium]
MNKKELLRDFGWAGGLYLRQCQVCKRLHAADKRAIACESCATGAAFEHLESENARLTTKVKLLNNDRTNLVKMLKERDLFPPDAGCASLAWVVEWALKENEK